MSHHFRSRTLSPEYPLGSLFAALPTAPLSVIFGIEGPSLTPEERELFVRHRPLGFILFRRNCQNPEQLESLIADLQALAAGAESAILIDQEGGPVARLPRPDWPAYPGARVIGCLAESIRQADGQQADGQQAGVRAAWLYGRLLAAPLQRLGINVNCAPVCDVLDPDCHPAIGARIFSHDPHLVTELASAACQGMISGRVLPVLKHVPGHGRALVDSHHQTPLIDASLAELDGRDFLPFRALHQMPLAMVAHVVVSAVDAANPATTSPKVIGGLIRDQLGYDGLLMSDDLVMDGLQGPMRERASAALAAGCDVVLHADGNLETMTDLVQVIPRMSALGYARWQRALGWLGGPSSIDEAALRGELDALLGFR